MSDAGSTSTSSDASRTVDFDPKWLPGSPHREAILESLTDGIAHVEEQGHGKPPVLVFQDGGLIPLPLVRYAETARGMQLVAGDVPDAPDQTKHRDVCGSIDEFKTRLTEDPGKAYAEKSQLLMLLHDVGHMLGRLQARRETYEVFVRELRALCDAMSAADRPDPAVASSQIRGLIERVEHSDAEAFVSARDEMFALAEAVRDVANRQERCIGRHKECAIQVDRLYREIKGRRMWKGTQEACG